MPAQMAAVAKSALTKAVCTVPPQSHLAERGGEKEHYTQVSNARAQA